MRALEKTVVVGKFLHLLRGGIHQFLAAVTEVYTPQPGHSIQDLISVGIVDVNTVSTGDDARTAFFSQFQQSGAEIAGEIADEMFGEDPIPFGEDKPVGMTKEAATALLPTLYAASGQDKDKFLAQLNGMPVVLTALGGIDAPEIAAVYS